MLIQEQKPHHSLKNTKQLLDTFQHPFIIKTLIKLDIEGTNLNIIKAIYDKPTASTILNSERLKVFSLKSETR